MTAGERRLAEQLEHKWEEDYLLCRDLPIGPRQTQSAFVMQHPHRSALILKVKAWCPNTIRNATREGFRIAPDGQTKIVMNSLQ